MDIKIETTVWWDAKIKKKTWILLVGGYVCIFIWFCICGIIQVPNEYTGTISMYSWYESIKSTYENRKTMTPLQEPRTYMHDRTYWNVCTANVNTTFIHFIFLNLTNIIFVRFIVTWIVRQWHSIYLAGLISDQIKHDLQRDRSIPNTSQSKRVIPV